jgi:hypothetical protein
MLVACSSSSSGSGAAGSGALEFQITLPNSAAINFPCSADSSGATVLDGTLQIACDTDAPGATNSATTVAGIFIPSFHGSDTYALEQAGADQSPIIEFTTDNVAYGAIVAAPGYAATTCSIQVTANATPKQGDAASGKFHCDNVVGNVVVGDGGYHASQITSVDGTFSGSFTQ